MKKITAFILTFAMVLSMATVAFAAGPSVPTVGNGTEQQEATVSVYKNLQVAEGITVPNTSFMFEITAVTSDAPKAAVDPIAYTSADTPKASTSKENGVVIYEIEKQSPIKFGPFPHAGVFEYSVKEKIDSFSGVEYSQEVYNLRVYVANKEAPNGGVYVQSITAENGKKEKQEKIIFTNTYRKEASLKILKQTNGALADKTKKFDFTIKFTNSATSNATEFIGTIDGMQQTFPVGQEVDFQLVDGQELIFENLPAGTRYVVTEIGKADGYIPKVMVVENGIVLKDKQGTDDANLDSSAENSVGNLVGENTNKVTFVNEYREVPITGVILNNMPFIILTGTAVLAFTVLLLLKRRKRSAQ